MAHILKLKGKPLIGNPDLKVWHRFARTSGAEFALLSQDSEDGSWRVVSTNAVEAALITLKDGLRASPENDGIFIRVMHFSELNTLDD